MITKLSTFAGTAPDGEPLVRLFRQGDSVRKVAGHLQPGVRDWLSTYKSDKENIALLVNALGGSDYWGQNRNGDIYHWAALIHDCTLPGHQPHSVDSFTQKLVPEYGYRTFLQALSFVHHINKDPNRAFGTVAVSCLNMLMKRVELVVLINRARAAVHGAQGFVDRIDNGETVDVSMGCRTPYDICTICGHKARVKEEYCDHVRIWGLNRILDDGRRIGLINPYPRFFDISFVTVGADRTAKTMHKFASVQDQLPSSVLDAERVYGTDQPSEGLAKVASVVSPVQTIDMVQEGQDRMLDKARGVYLDRHASPGARLLTELQLTRTSDKEPPQEAVKASPDANVPMRDGGVLQTNADTDAESADSTKVANEKELQAPPSRGEFPLHGRYTFQGLPILVENAKGTWRVGKGWKTKMKNDYGEIEGSLGSDGDPVDVYIGPYESSKNVYIVHQNYVFGPKRGQYDEDKVMLGFRNAREAKRAYLKHYDTPEFLRSITEMSLEQFKKLIGSRKERGEKLASMEKVAEELSLDDLFSRPASTRERIWKDTKSGKTTCHEGSGLGATFDTMQKTAAAEDSLDALFKVSGQKYAEIVKEIGPDMITGQVLENLTDREAPIASDTLDALGKDVRGALSTLSGMGIVLKPEEFQRILFSAMGKPELANELDKDRKTFVVRMSSGVAAPCDPLGPEHFSAPRLLQLLPFLENRSYLEPVVQRRIIRIQITPKVPPPDPVDSPLLTKVGAAYNWYRTEMHKVASKTPELISAHPALNAGVFGVDDSDLFEKEASAATTITAALASVPASLMYSASLRRDIQKGKDVGLLKRLAADHPYLFALGSGAAVREVMKNPTANRIVGNVIRETAKAGKRIFTDKA